ncbi:Bacterial extracellular solute-binding protein [compost metagenome]
MDQVLEEFYKRTKDTLNVKLDIEWSPLADHKEKVKLKMAAGEKVDIVFDATWANLNNLSRQGAYIDLTKYFNNDQYPGLKKAFSQQLLDANKIDGKTFSVPFIQYFGGADGIFIRKDLRENYGLQPIKSEAELETFFKKVKENDPTMVPLSVEGRRGFYNIFKPQFPASAPTMIVGAGGHWNVVFSTDYKKVMGAVILGDAADKYAGFPDGFNKPEVFYDFLNKHVAWNKYLEKDAISQKDKVGLFASGKAAAVENDNSQFSTINTKLKAGVPGGTLEFYSYNKNIQNLTPGGIATDYLASNSVAIPATSGNADRAMMFIDWIFQSQENHDLFEFGIKGVNWEPVGDKEFKPIGTHNFPGYELTWNPNFIRLSSELDENSKKIYTYLADPSTYSVRRMSGFKFDPTPVKTEIAKIQPKYDEFAQVINNGLVANPLEEAQKRNKEWQSLGLEKVRAEVIKQLQAYIDAGGK